MIYRNYRATDLVFQTFISNRRTLSKQPLVVADLYAMASRINLQRLQIVIIRNLDERKTKSDKQNLSNFAYFLRTKKRIQSLSIISTLPRNSILIDLRYKYAQRKWSWYQWNMFSGDAHRVHERHTKVDLKKRFLKKLVPMFKHWNP